MGSKKLRSLTPEQEEYLLKLSKEVDEERKKKEQEEREKEEEEEREKVEEEKKKKEEETKGQIMHRQLVKTAECQEHERIIRRIEDHHHHAPKQGKDEETEPEEGEVCSSAMPSDEEKDE